MINSSLNLSKLSRGKGERKGSLIEVVYEEKDLHDIGYESLFFNTTKKSTGNESKDSLKSTNNVELPKTFTTRKGQLLIFSEDYTSASETNFLHPKKSHHNNSNKATRAVDKLYASLDSESLKSINTTNELRKNILQFGMNTHDLERSNTIDSWTLYDKKKSQSKRETDETSQKIRPGYSAKRYFVNVTKRWKPELLDDLYKHGKIRTSQNGIDTNDIGSSFRRINDDLSRIPPAYRFEPNWASLSYEDLLKGYCFYRVKSSKPHKNSIINQTIDLEKSRFHFTEYKNDDIKIVDKNGNNIDYSNLDRANQEAVLAELLLQTALQSINEKRMASYEKTITGNEFMYHKDHPNEPNLIESSYFSNKLKVKDLNAREMLSSTHPSSYLFPALNGNKLTSSLNKNQRVKNETKKASMSIKIFSNTHQSNAYPQLSNDKNISLNISHGKLKLPQSTQNSDLFKSEFIGSEVVKSTDEPVNHDPISSVQNENQPPPSEQNNTRNSPDQQLNNKISENDNNNINNNNTHNIYLNFLKEDPTTHKKTQISKICMEEALPKMTKPENNANVISQLKKELSEKGGGNLNGKKDLNTNNSLGVIVIGPNGEIIQIGKNLFERLSDSVKQNLKKKEDDLVYRLFEKIPPYLYYTYKLANSGHVPYDGTSNNPDDKQISELNVDLSQKIEEIPIDSSQIINASNSLMSTSMNEDPLDNKEIIKTLLEHAQDIAKKAMLSTGSGFDLVKDIKICIDLLAKNDFKPSLLNNYINHWIQPPVTATNTTTTINTTKTNTSKTANASTNPNSNTYPNSNINVTTDTVINIPPDQNNVNNQQKITDIKTKSPKKPTNSEKKLVKQTALNENMLKLTEAYKTGEINTNQFGQYQKIMKDSLKQSLTGILSKTPEFSSIVIDDNLLNNLLAYPTEEFEVMFDKQTSKNKIQLKKSKDKRLNKPKKNEVERKNVEKSPQGDQEEVEDDSNSHQKQQIPDDIKVKSIKASEPLKPKVEIQNQNPRPPAEQPVNVAPVINVDQSADKEQKKKKKKKKNSKEMDNSALNQGENTNEVKVETKLKDTKVEANDKLKLPKIEDDNKVTKTKKTFKFGPVKESRLGGGLGDADDDGEDKKAKTQKKSKKKLIEEIQAHLMEKKVQKQKQTDESGKKNENNNKKITLEENDFEGIDINEMDRIQMQEAYIKAVDAVEVREFKRKLAAEEKRKEMARRRAEMDEQKRREAEEEEKKARTAKEIAEETKRKDEEMRLKRLAEAAKRKKEEEALAELEKKQKLDAEMEKKAKEEYARKMEEMRAKLIEEMRQKAKMDQERRLELERIRQEEERLLLMSDHDNVNFNESKSRLDRHVISNASMKNNTNNDDELNRALMEAKRLAAEESERKAKQEMRISFLKSIKDEACQFESSKLVSRAFVFSYYDLMRYMAAPSHHKLRTELSPPPPPNNFTNK